MLKVIVIVGVQKKGDVNFRGKKRRMGGGRMRTLIQLNVGIQKGGR